MKTTNVRKTSVRSFTAYQAPPILKYPRKVLNKAKNKRQSTPSSTSKVMKKIRMREWLEELLDQNLCKGLKWANKAEKKFKITWYHASRSDFDASEHANLFIRYAEFTGKTKLIEKCKVSYDSKLKSNFRSALNSLIDCIRVDEPSLEQTEQGNIAVKVYKFIEPTHPMYQKKRMDKKLGTKRLSTMVEEPSTSKRSKKSVKEKTTRDTDEDTKPDLFVLEANLAVGKTDTTLFSLLETDEEDEVSFMPNEDTIQLLVDFLTDQPVSETKNHDYIAVPDDTGDSLSTVPPHSDSTFPIPCLSLPPGPPTASCSNSNQTLLSPSLLPVPNFITTPPASTPPTLPDFNALELNVIFNKPIKQSSLSLTSGGHLLVKKEKVFTPQLAELQIINVAETETTLNMANILWPDTNVGETVVSCLTHQQSQSPQIQMNENSSHPESDSTL